MQVIPVSPLSITAFENFGSIVSPDEEVKRLDSSQKNANQGTAIKLLQVSHIDNQFPQSLRVKNPSCNLFRCFPKNTLQKRFTLSDSNGLLKKYQHEIKVLEKHPFSTQTFIPMGRDIKTGYAYLVVTALPDKNGEPDLLTLQAFLCKSNQAVTYGAGVWHAPMIVVGEEEYLDFTVIINELLDNNQLQYDLEERFYDSQLTLNLYC